MVDTLMEAAMHDFFTRGFSLLVTAAAMVVILPLLAQLFFSLGPIGFIVVIFVVFAVGAAYTK